MSSSKFEEFLGKVTSRVKWKAAHSMIKKELTTHLEQLSGSYQNQEISKQEAEEKAIAEMGNPYTVGDNLNRIHKPKWDWVLLSIFIVIAGISFLPLIGGVPELAIPGSHYMQRQLIWCALAIMVILGLLFVDYRKLLSKWKLFTGAGMGLLLYTHLFGISVRGVNRWIIIGDYIIDTSAITLLLLFIGWAGILSKLHLFSSWKKQGLLLVFFWLPILFYTVMPYVMMSIIYFVCIVTMFVFSGVSKQLALKTLAINIVFGLFWLSFHIYYVSNNIYLWNRLLAFMNPQEYASTTGYIPLLISDVLSQAGWFGNGLYAGVDRRILPEAHTDFVFPWLVHSLGWAFGIFVCLLLMLFILRISFNAFQTKDLFGRLLVIGGAALLTVPICWNILMVLGLLPIMGVSLPFISYGGTMLVSYSAVLGLILSVHRRKGSVGNGSSPSFGCRNSG